MTEKCSVTGRRIPPKRHLLSASVIAALALTFGADAYAGTDTCEVSGNKATCTGDQSAGITDDTDTELEVTELTKPIATAGPGVAHYSIGLHGANGSNDGGVVTTGENGQSGGSSASLSTKVTAVIDSDHSVGLLVGVAGGSGGSGGDGNGASGEGGHGGVGGNSGNAVVDFDGSVLAGGGAGIKIGAVGGRGGDGGNGNGLKGRGGGAGRGGNGGDVDVTNRGEVTTATDHGHGLLAQSIGGDGGRGGDGNGTKGIGANGADGGRSGSVSVHNAGTLVTQGADAHGIFAISQGGSGGRGGSSEGISASGGDGGSGGNAGSVFVDNDGAIHTQGSTSHGVLAQSIGGVGAGGGSASGVYGGGGDGSHGGVASVVTVSGDDQGSIITEGDDAYGILAQSIGGGGGVVGSAAGLVGIGGGGGAGSEGGEVVIDTANAISTGGARATAIVGQSIGGGGGAGTGGRGFVGIGGSGSAAGSATLVSITSAGVLSTSGEDSHGMLAQSIGGGGGLGASAGGFVAVGGAGGAGGSGGEVRLINSGSITLAGARSIGMLGQSVGGGGGSAAGSAGIIAIGGGGQSGGDAGDVGLRNTGAIDTQGIYGHAMLGQSIGGGGGYGALSVGLVGIGGDGDVGGTGGTVTLTNTGTLATTGRSAAGMFAQSIGGGGGAGGGAGGVVSIGGQGGGGGAAGAVTAINSGGTITTVGDDSAGILAQAVGGGGGAGGFAASAGLFASVGIGGNGGSGGDGGTVTAGHSGSIATSGNRSYGVLAQSIGGGGGAGGFSVAGSLGAFGSVSVAIGGSGGAGGAGGLVTVDNAIGTITTKGTGAHGVYAQSIGGGGGASGYTVAASLSAGMEEAASVAVGIGGYGGDGGDGGQVNVNSLNDIVTRGDNAQALFAQSVGGGGGDGGWSGSFAGAGAGGAVSLNASIGGHGGNGGAGGAVSVDSRSNLVTTGRQSLGLLAQSVGGGGGNGGFAVGGSIAGGQTSASFGVSVGGCFSISETCAGGAGGTVSVSSRGDTWTEGDLSKGVVAQSIGGGGGNGGWAGQLSGAIGGSGAATLAVALGGNGGNGGDAAAAHLIVGGSVHTMGSSADAVVAQSIGGGGGNGGFALTGSFDGGGQGGFAVGASLGGCLVQQAEWMKDRSQPMPSCAGGKGDQVDVTTLNAIATVGDQSAGIVAQSIGGGGGNGGWAGALAGSLSGERSVSIGVALGGFGGSGDEAGQVTADSRGKSVVTAGDNAAGILAQSIGGGGGNGGLALSASFSLSQAVDISPSIGGFGGTGGKGGAVTVTNTSTIASAGGNSIGILAQSIGGGGGNGGLALGAAFALSQSINISPSLGGFGGTGGEGGTATVTNKASISTVGDNSIGLLAQSIGGGGGMGGSAGDMAISGSESVNVSIAIGGRGGNGNSAQEVNVANSGDIWTKGEFAYGAAAQSIGGGGGAGGFAGLDTSSWAHYLESGECVSDPHACVPGNAGGAIAGGLGSKTFNMSVSVGGFGGTGGDGGRASLTNDAAILTEGDEAHGLFVQSIGGGGGAGGVSTAATGAFGASGSGTLSLAVGGFGGAAGNGDLVQVVNRGQIEVDGAGSYGIYAQSVGGGGGAGGDTQGFFLQRVTEKKLAAGALPPKSGLEIAASIGGFGGAAGDGGDVRVDNTGTILTTGAGDYGLFAQSVGGGGGSGGKTSATGVEMGTLFKNDYADDNRIWSLAIGGFGGASGSGGGVYASNAGRIETRADGAMGIFAQSIGGGGGDGGGANSGLLGRLSIGGSGGASGDGGLVNVVNSGSIETFGIGAHGIYAESIGGGGGNGGTAAFGTVLSVASDVFNKIRVDGLGGLGKFFEDRFKSVRKDFGLAIGGSGGAAGNGGDISITNSGVIVTHADGSDGIFAQSVGGGGGDGGAGNSISVSKIALGGTGGTSGNGGNITIDHSGDITVDGYGSYGIFAQSIGGGGGKMGDISLGVEDFQLLTLDLSDFARGGGNGGDITINSTGNITVLKDGGMAFFAQSVGGSGGLFVGSLFGMMGTLGGDGKGGVVTIHHQGNLVAPNINGIGAILQSDGGTGAQNIVATFDGAVFGGSALGRGIRISGGADNRITLMGPVGAQSNVAIEADYGNDTIDNRGYVEGNVLLGSGSNAFTTFAGATFRTLDTIDLNGGLFTNQGTLLLGAPGVAQTTVLNGSFVQSGGASMPVDVGFGTASDQLKVTGTATLGGTVSVNLLHLADAKDVVLIDGSGAAKLDGATVADTLALDYGLHAVGNDIVLRIDRLRFDQAGVTPNQKAIGAYLNRTLEAGGADDLSGLFVTLASTNDRAAYDAMLDSLSPESYAVEFAQLISASTNFTDSLFDCRADDSSESWTTDGTCTWVHLSRRDSLRRKTATHFGYDEDAQPLFVGTEVALGDHFTLSASAGHEKIRSNVERYADSSGNRVHFGAALEYASGGWRLAGALSGGRGHSDVRRFGFSPGVVASTPIDTNWLLGRGRVEYVVDGGGWSLRPRVDVDAARMVLRPFHESGAGAQSLVGDGANRRWVTVMPALQASINGHIGKLVARPFASVGGRWQSRDSLSLSAAFQGSPSGTAPFTVNTGIDRMTAHASIGLDLIDPGPTGLDVRVSYDGEFGKTTRQHSASLNIGMRF